jgi:proteic killer suppression protein
MAGKEKYSLNHFIFYIVAERCVLRAAPFSPSPTHACRGKPFNFDAFCLLDNCHVIVYSTSMIRTFADKETQKLFVSGKSKRLPSDLLRRAIRRLEFIHFANDINDLLVPPSNRLHALKGDRKGQHSISINDQWRICFHFIEGDAYDVEITDYH